MESILDTVKDRIRKVIREDSIVADFTMGNGSDTLFLRQLVPMGHVYAFDIQPEALESTQKRLMEADVEEGVTLILDCHSHCDQYISSPIDVGMFNLGYLPNHDKTITTKQETTWIAVEKAIQMLTVEGIVVIVVYPGHLEGRIEGDMLQERLAQLAVKQYDVLLHRLINVPHCPYFIAVQRRK